MRLFPTFATAAAVCLSLTSSLAADKKPKATEETEEPAPGHLLYANTVGEKGWSFFVLDGEDVNPSGIEAGYRSSWVSYPAGKRKLQFEHQPLGIVDLEAELQPGALHAFIAYSDFVPQKDRGRPPRPVLAIKELRCDLVIPAEKRKGNRLVLINLTPSPSLRLRVGEEMHEAPRLQETLVKVPRRGGVAEIHVLPSPGLPVTQAAPAVEPVPDPAEDAPVFSQELNLEDPGTRFLLFYMSSQNTVQSLLFDDIGMNPNETNEAH